LATYALCAVSRWDEALRMAHSWRDRVIGDTIKADMQIAQIQLMLGDSDGAIATVNPYLSAPQVQPDQKAAVLFIEARAMLQQDRVREAADLLWPTVQSNPAIRPAWINFAAGYLPPNLSEQWLTRMGTQMDSEPNSEGGQVDLALAWNILSRRTGDKKYSQMARQIIARLKQNPACGATVLLTDGIFLEEDGDTKGAEDAYRRSVAKEDNAAAKNNLAMLLVDHGGDLNEAEDLARQCVKARPAATYYDTLADVLATARKYDQALVAMQSAMRLDPSNAKWHVNMAKLLVASGKPEQARVLIADLDLMNPGVRSLDDAHRQELDALRRQLSGPAASASH
jgi:tetratricopeptide (TPR) repeat protein